MFTLNVTVIARDLDIFTKALSAIPGAYTRGGQRAVNSTATGLRLEAAKWVSEKYNIKQKEILDRLKVTRAKSGEIRAIAAGSGKKANQGLPYKLFTLKKYQSGSSTRHIGGGIYTPPIGVPIKIKRSGSYKPYPGLFSQTMRSKHHGLFLRSVRPGIIMEEQYVATPLNILAQGEYPGKVDKYVEKKLLEELTRQIDRELK